MIWLWILGILAAVTLLLCLTPVGILASMEGGEVQVSAKIGFLRIRLFPRKEKKAKEKKQRAKKKPAEDSGKKEKRELKPLWEDLKDAVRTLWPPLKRALARLGRGVRVHPLRLSVVFGGGKDPVSAAKLYGYVNGGVWTGMPVLEDLMNIPDPHIHVGLDFTAEKNVIEGVVGVTARIGTLLAVGFGAGIPALKWFLRYRKKQKQTPAAPPEQKAA